jgi:PAS domain S-box-containing protein
MADQDLSRQQLEKSLAETKRQLGERVKELRCLYDMVKLAEESENRPDKLLSGMPAILCRSWQYPEITCARVAFQNMEYCSANYKQPKWKQSQAILFFQKKAGIVEVGYLEKKPPLSEGPFLTEERDLINAVAERLGHVLERWENQKQLDHSRAMFQRLSDNARDVIYRMSLPDGRYEFINRACESVFGFPQEDFYEKPALIAEIIHPDDRQYLKDEWEKLLAGDMNPTYEYKVVDKDGHERWLHQRNVLVTDDSGRPVAIEGIVSDITEKATLIEDLRTAKEGLDRKVEEKTAQLEKELEEAKAREAIIKRQGDEILELSTPVLQIADRIVLAPLIGVLDSQRTQRFTEVLLDKIVDSKSDVVIIDITGVPNIDTQTAQHIIETTSAVRLLGCETVLTGIQPAIAQTLVQLGIDLSAMKTLSSLAQGLAAATRMLNS